MEADVAIVKNINSWLVEQLVQTERQCLENAHYSRGEWIPTSVKYDVHEEKVCDIFHEIGVQIGQRNIQACHRIKTTEI